MKASILILAISSFIISGCAVKVTPVSNGLYAGTGIVEMYFETGSAQWGEFDQKEVDLNADRQCKSRGYSFAKYHDTRTICTYYLPEAASCATNKTSIIYYCK